MSDRDRRSAPPRDLDDWNAALGAVDRLAKVREALEKPLDEALLERDVAEIRAAALRLDAPRDFADDDEDARNTRRRRIAWVVFGAIWLMLTFMAAGSIGAILHILT